MGRLRYTSIMWPKPQDWVELESGMSFNVKERLRDLGCDWHKDTKRWWCPQGPAAEAQRLVDLGGYELEDFNQESQEKIKAMWAERAAERVQDRS